MTIRLVLITLALLANFLYAAVTTVDKVDLNRYLGKWYQYAYYPNSFQPKDAALSAAEYSLDSKGRILVVNTSYKDKAGTQILKQVSGKAHATDKSFSKLRVSFFWPFYGDYWIVKLDKDYQYSVISDRKQKYLWILSRNPRLSKDTYAEILQFLNKGGWDTSKIVVTGLQ
ncbi:MAG: lipocalin family protein [Candidatus Cloacimonadaceae bacterium]|jgi:apolipoprotein D and lipocalin family protein|nr:lipocalin family protein [Candidatus Cloacimonadaceae bacterium]HQB98074.1 lipocalin family protein [Candidatus Cloacimonadota bacterium]